MDSVTQWPKNGLAALEQKIAMEHPVDAQQQNNNEQTLKTLCIRAEILTNQETPAEDKALRMQYQVSRLQQGFGQATSASDSNSESHSRMGHGRACPYRSLPAVVRALPKVSLKVVVSAPQKPAKTFHCRWRPSC